MILEVRAHPFCCEDQGESHLLDHLVSRLGRMEGSTDEVYRPVLALAFLHQSSTDYFLGDCQVHQDWVIGSRVLNDGSGCQELLELLEYFFTSVVPAELGGLPKQLDHRSRLLSQTGDEPGEGGQAP